MGQGRGRDGEGMRNAIHDEVERLPGGRGQLHRDIVIDGQVVMSHRLGSPAPYETVAQHERHVDLDYTPACPACGGIDVQRDQFRIRRCADSGAVIR
jgi:hypothetical protein